MRLFQVLLPKADNLGQSARKAVAACQRHFIAVSNGCTAFQDAQGIWTTPSGPLNSESMLLHWVACQPRDWHDTIVPFIVAAFPDQLAFMTIEPEGVVRMVPGRAAAPVEMVA